MPREVTGSTRADRPAPRPTFDEIAAVWASIHERGTRGIDAISGIAVCVGFEIDELAARRAAAARRTDHGIAA